MDDGRLTGKMSFKIIATELAAMRASMDAQFAAIDKRFDGIDRRFDAVHEELNHAKIRDEELHRLMTFGLEAREGLRESMGQRFDALEKKQDEDIGLLKDVLRHVTGSRASR